MEDQPHIYLDINEEIEQKIPDSTTIYPLYSDPEFNLKILNKKEFSEIYNENKLSLAELNQMENINTNSFTLNSQQLFVRNFLSLNTPYNNLLLYHGLGTGKTCTSITVALEKIKYMIQTNTKKKVYIVANPNVQDNFKKELYSEEKLVNTHGEWRLLTCVGSELLSLVNPTNENLDSTKLLSKLKLFTNEWFEFMGYTKLSNIINDSISNNILIDTFEESLIIIDEIHNIRVSDDAKNKRIADSLVSLVKRCKVQLLLLSATPMFNNYKEIIWLTNLMNMNDRRPITSIQEIFDSSGNFRIDKETGEEVGLHKFVRKITGYVSYVQGEDPVNFPFRIFPTDFNNERSILKQRYPTIQFNGLTISIPLKHIDVYTIELNDYQENVYNFILKNINLSQTTNIENLGYQTFQIPLNILNICYPNSMYDDIQNNPDTNFNKTSFVENVGKGGLKSIFGDLTSFPFQYDKEFENTYGKIFTMNKLRNYSAKIHEICELVDASEGISLIYSEKIYSGVLPTAIALEEMGFTRYNGNNLLGNKKKSKLKYAMITGNSIYSPNNKLEIEACVNKNNINGENIKVIIISRAGSEGIDLKYMRNIHILEPWYNMNRSEQVIGRGIRNRSHMMLPIEKRNCCIHLYGSVLKNKQESIDLYIYRLAEDKSMKIGKISRVLKETSVDCMLTKNENIRFFETDVSSLPQKLSNNKNITFDINKKAFSSACDYLETCSYSCMLYDKSYKKIELHGTNDLSTYNSNHLSLNVNDIIIRIKDLFKERYYYTKFDIINHVCINKQYSINVIDYALKEIVDNNLIVAFDRYNRKGTIIHINDLYLFQPSEINNKFIPLEDRMRPIGFKNDDILIKFNNSANIVKDAVKEDSSNDIPIKFIKGVIKNIRNMKDIIDGIHGKIDTNADENVGNATNKATMAVVKANMDPAAKADKDAEKARAKAVKDAEKARAKAVKDAEKARVKADNADEKDRAKAVKAAEKAINAAEKAQVKANKAAEKATKAAENKLHLDNNIHKKKLELKRKKEGNILNRVVDDNAGDNNDDFAEESSQKGGKFSDKYNITKKQYISSSIEMIFDNLSIPNKKKLIIELYDNKSIKYDEKEEDDDYKSTEIITEFNNFIKANIMENEFDMMAFILGYDDNRIIFIVKQQEDWIDGSTAYLALFTSNIRTKAEKYQNTSIFYKYIGLNIYYNEKVIFKIKDNTNHSIHNSGARCNQLKKSYIKDVLGDIFDGSGDIDRLVKKKIAEICDFIQFMLIYLTQVNKSDKIWFLNSLETAKIKYAGIFKVSKIN